MNVLTDNEKGLLVLEHLGPKALAHDTMSLLEAFELGLKVAEQEVIKRLAAGVSVEPVAHQRIDPETKERVWDEDSFTSHPNDFDESMPLYTATAIAAARVQENERCARTLEAIGCQGYADALRALLGKEQL